MCREMSQYIPNTAISSETVATPTGRAAQVGRPEMRPDQAATRLRRSVRPARWAMPRVKTTVVATKAAVVAPITSPAAAPPAGLEDARTARVWNIGGLSSIAGSGQESPTPLDVTHIHVT